MVTQVFVPDVGEAQDVEVIEILVGAGDDIEVDTSLVVLESDKASMEIPSPAQGKIGQISVKVGYIVQEGHLILELESVEEAPLSSSVAGHEDLLEERVLEGNSITDERELSKEDRLEGGNFSKRPPDPFLSLSLIHI